MSHERSSESVVGNTGHGPGTQHVTLQTLPVELLAEIFSELDLDSLVVVSCLSRKLRAVTADDSLNPWRRPIQRNLQRRVYEKSLHHLSVRSTIPRHNWIDILTFAPPSFLLFDGTLPNLKSSEWEECFRRRFLPGWTKWRMGSLWRETFMKMLYRVWHRGRTSCTSDESWTKYVVLNRNGTLNELEATSRSFNPLALFNDMKLQNNLARFPTQMRVVLQLMDVRILALGVLDHPRTSLMVNRNARAFLCPPGLAPPGASASGDSSISNPNISDYEQFGSMGFNTPYRRLLHPVPSHTHNNYPMYTPGGGDQRWHASALLEEGTQWVGGLMVVAQLHPSDTYGSIVHEFQGPEPVGGIDHTQFASFTREDILAIAPWMEPNLTRCIYGHGLGIP